VDSALAIVASPLTSRLLRPGQSVTPSRRSFAPSPPWDSRYPATKDPLGSDSKREPDRATNSGARMGVAPPLLEPRDDRSDHRQVSRQVARPFEVEPPHSTTWKRT